ncbi:uncharacterized protein NMK_1924 [Novimethylophilus kurashikiensis]|uniref:receptor protein-tyrosine kinase n=1 Tax=Novimethylophilus kurashikiensis TaxID=1825523 RepID=A0A2R5F7Y3_9PROT|nr:glycine-rich protein [Novimethylophilus kurashikiensis]GBG14326.1 uncharacterized protein NMK_1924 [Novimethylophilus kurashikiensis]
MKLRFVLRKAATIVALALIPFAVGDAATYHQIQSVATANSTWHKFTVASGTAGTWRALSSGATACFSRKVGFTANTSWTIPADNCGTIRIKAWGAGGADYSAGNVSKSGGGGFAQADYGVTPGSTVLVAVGGGGGVNVAGTNGGGGGVATFYGGGGYSGVFLNNSATQANAIVIAGGGGACATLSICNAGAGGGSSGQNGSTAGGGTQTAGGTNYNSGTTGSALKGGATIASNNSGGGGGWFGGGATGASGGGSGHVISGATNTILTTGNVNVVANAADVDYVAGKGNGANISSGTASGQPGYVVIYY